jgi:hypothetical protein
MEGARKRFEREQQLAAWTAWHTAALTRVNKMPNLRDIMPRRKRRQSVDEMIAIAKAWSARGGRQ